jgi:hypothetical protein
MIHPDVSYYRVSFLDLENEIGFYDYTIITANVLREGHNVVVVQDDTEKTTLGFYYYVSVVSTESGHIANADILVILNLSELRVYNTWRRLIHTTVIENCRLEVNHTFLLKLFEPYYFIHDFYNEFGERVFLYKLFDSLD